MYFRVFGIVFFAIVSLLYCATCRMCCMVLFISHCTVLTALDVTYGFIVMCCVVLGFFFHTAFCFAYCIECIVLLGVIFSIVVFILYFAYSVAL